jgi:8-oxo-dGTP pyrophosphatase MutT (NUDIX family)
MFGVTMHTSHPQHCYIRNSFVLIHDPKPYKFRQELQSMIHEKSCGVVLRNNEHYLLLHYESGHWDFPKGHVEKGEAEEQTAQRELREETGIAHAEIVPGFRETISYFYNLKGKTRRKEVVFFLMTTFQREVNLSHEHIGFLWLPYDAALKQLTFKNAKDVLTKAHEFFQHNQK